MKLNQSNNRLDMNICFLELIKLERSSICSIRSSNLKDYPLAKAFTRKFPVLNNSGIPRERRYSGYRLWA